jgi:hypothetical protein
MEDDAQNESSRTKSKQRHVFLSLRHSRNYISLSVVLEGRGKGLEQLLLQCHDHDGRQKSTNTAGTSATVVMIIMWAQIALSLVIRYYLLRVQIVPLDNKIHLVSFFCGKSRIIFRTSGIGLSS